MTGLQSLLAAELVACIQQGRHPTIRELCRVTDRVRRDVQRRRSAFQWRSPANPAIDKASRFEWLKPH